MTEETPAPPPPPPVDEEDLLFPPRMPHMGSFTRVVSPGKTSTPKSSAQSALGGPRKSGGGLKASNVLIFALWGTAAIGLVTFAARKELVRAMAQSWLSSQRVASELHIDEVSFGHISGAAKLGGIGPGAHVPPDLSLRHFDIDFSLNLFAGNGHPMARIKSARLQGVDAAFAYKAGKLNFGALDAIVQKALKTPSSPEDAVEHLEIDALRLKVATDFGQVEATGGMRLSKGQVESLNLIVPKTILHGPNGGGQINAGSLKVTSLRAGKGSERHLEANLDAQRFDVNLDDVRDTAGRKSDFSVESLTLNLKSQLPSGEGLFPAGAMKTHIDFKAGTIQSPGSLLKGVAARLDFDGRLSQTHNRTQIDGRSSLEGHIDRLRAGDVFGQKLDLHSQDPAGGQGLAIQISAKPLSPLLLSLDGPVTLDALQGQAGGGIGLSSGHVAFSHLGLKLDEGGISAEFDGQGRFRSLNAPDLTLASVVTRLKGTVHADSPQVVDDSLGTPHAAWEANFNADLSSTGARYTGLAAAARQGPADAPSKDAPVDAIVALDQAGRRFNLDVKGVSVDVAGSGPLGNHADRLDISLKSPAVITSATGGRIELSPVAGQPVIANGKKGAVDVSLSGGDLPQVKASLRQILMQPQSGALTAKYDINAEFTQTPLHGATLKGQGDLLSRDGHTDINLAECASLEAKDAMLGSRLTALKGVICQGNEPVLRLMGGTWEAAGTFKDFAALVPESEVRVSGANGLFNAQSLSNGGLAFEAKLKETTVSDALDAVRFNPLSFAGQVSQSAKALEGSFTARVKNEEAFGRNPKPIVKIDIKGDVPTASGHIAIHADALDFTPEGLQPLDLTPTVAGIASSNVTGSVTFDGVMDYTPKTSTSGGKLNLKAINFDGPLGTGRNLNSEVEFTSLTPLLSKPSQPITLDEFRALLTFTQMKTALEFKGDRVALSRSDGLSPGGTVVLEPMDVPLDDKGEIRGALLFDGLDFGAVIKKTDLAKDVDFTGKLSGKVPFWIGNIEGIKRIRFDHGQLKSDGPGRLSLNPAVLTSVQGGGAAIAKEKGDKIEGGSLADPSGFYRQAMSNIAFDEIEVDINTRKDGVVEPKFHIKGQFDPPHKQEARIGFGDLLSGKWQQKTLDLPSGTKIDLTVETPFNLDQILDDLMRQSLPDAPPVKAPAKPAIKEPAH